MRDTHIVIVTGLSGSGKSVAIKCFEDLGFYCIDNLPTVLLPTFAELCAHAGDIRRIALGIDIRDREFPISFPAQISALRQAGFACEILFLEARDEVLTRRYSETRRKHPLAEQVPVPEAITLERDTLAGLRAIADRIIDTSDYNVHQLRDCPGLVVHRGESLAAHDHLGCCRSAISMASPSMPIWCSMCASCPIRTLWNICGLAVAMIRLSWTTSWPRR